MRAAEVFSNVNSLKNKQKHALLQKFKRTGACIIFTEKMTCNLSRADPKYWFSAEPLCFDCFHCKKIVRIDIVNWKCVGYPDHLLIATN